MIDDHAVIDPGCSIGSGSRIWHFSHVCRGAKIGENCTLGQNVFVDRDVRIGDRCKIQNNVSVYRGVTLDDDVFLGPSCVFTNVKNPRSAFPTEVESYGQTLVGQGATIGANATIICGVKIGHHAFIGAGAVVTEDVPAHALMLGVPARFVWWMCRCGLRLPDRERDCGSFEYACSCGRVYHLDMYKQTNGMLREMTP